jgi:glycosyltransferase involved in cell wall biosynthesis
LSVASAKKPQVSVVIAAYEMPRQIERTVRSLSPTMQLGIDADDYELIVVDNGSRETIDSEGCERWGALLRWIRIDDAPPSPAMALNRGIAAASAPLVGAMIDGARMASPGLLEHALIASATCPRPVIASLGFHLGSQPQRRAIKAGYDAGAEAALLDEIGWEEDGYRLFDISVPAVSSNKGWLVPPLESNALFMPTELWSELGGFAEEFSAPGGGMVNLDLFARACELPDSRLIILLGEATFHQVHGGVATNDLTTSFAEMRVEYERLRGHPYQRPTVQPLLLGELRSRALPAFERSLRQAASEPV